MSVLCKTTKTVSRTINGVLRLEIYFVIAEFVWRTKEYLNLILTSKNLYVHLSGILFYSQFLESKEDKVHIGGPYCLRSTLYGVRVHKKYRELPPIDIFVEKLPNGYKCDSICLNNQLFPTEYVDPHDWSVIRVFNASSLVETLNRTERKIVKVRVSRFVSKSTKNGVLKLNHNVFELRLSDLGLGEQGKSTGYFFTRKAATFFLFYHIPSKLKEKDIKLVHKEFEISEHLRAIKRLQNDNDELRKEIARLSRLHVSKEEIEVFWDEVYEKLEYTTTIFDECDTYVEFLSSNLNNPLVEKVRRVFFMDYNLSALKLLESLGYHINPKKYNFAAKVNAFLFHGSGGVRVVGLLHDMGSATTDKVYYDLSKKAKSLHVDIKNYIVANFEKLDIVRVADNYNVDKRHDYIKRKDNNTLVEIVKILGDGKIDEDLIRFNTRSLNLPPLFTPDWNSRMDYYVDTLVDMYNKKDWILLTKRNMDEINIGEVVDMGSYNKSYSRGNTIPIGIEKNNCKNAGDTCKKLIEFLKLLKRVNPRFYELVIKEAGDFDFHRFKVWLMKLAYDIFNKVQLQQQYEINPKDCRSVLNTILLFDNHHIIDSIFESMISMRKSKSKKVKKAVNRRDSVRKNILPGESDSEEESESDDELEEDNEDWKKSCGRIFEVWNFFHEDLTGKYNITTSMERRFTYDFEWMLGFYFAALRNKNKYMKMMDLNEKSLNEEVTYFPNHKNAKYFIDDKAELKAMAWVLFEAIPTTCEFIPNLVTGQTNTIFQSHIELEGVLIGVNSTNYQKTNMFQLNFLLNLYERDRIKAKKLLRRICDQNSMIIEILFGSLYSLLPDNQKKTLEKVQQLLHNLFFTMNAKKVWEFHGLNSRSAYGIDTFCAKEKHVISSDNAICMWIKDRKNNYELMRKYNRRRRTKDRKHIKVFVGGSKRAVVPIFREARGSRNVKPVEYVKDLYFRSTNHPETVSYLLSNDNKFNLKKVYESYMDCKAFRNCKDDLVEVLKELSKVEIAKHSLNLQLTSRNFFGGKNPGGSAKKGIIYTGNKERERILEAIGPFIMGARNELSREEADQLRTRYNIVDLSVKQIRYMMEYRKKVKKKEDGEYVPEGNE